ncbi:hypothetical protein [Nesterenkonia sp. HG001]|uniref:hypothetical protein n=1 Tax=Nesterenkonia sp. HG001 TaxID=2983207 RepID=UPI002AC44323|nr:hypothetical protein [Nesterenkonia sp. HG001]MDZ5076511.1 hypothetical protein [Nesterenkonia sp. HG001]
MNTADLAMSRFEHTTARWGRATMGAVLMVSLAAPLILLAVGDFDITFSQLLTAYLAVAAVYLVLAMVEPITYFPILGQAAMYQAFMIGNIANKLLPAAIVAQNRLNVRPGSRKGDLVAVMAICGAAVVHIVSLLLFVGVLGTWLLSVVPEPVIEIAQLYILPAILGAVVVQAVVTVRQARSTGFALVMSLLVILVLVPLAPAIGPFGIALAVLLTVLASWFFRGPAGPHEEDGDAAGDRPVVPGAAESAESGEHRPPRS